MLKAQNNRFTDLSEVIRKNGIVIKHRRAICYVPCNIILIL